jgi:DNA-binding GntR family transcriptional regulator
MTRSGTVGTSKSRIYSDLRRSIGVGSRRPGERLELDKLAHGYGTSITPVRDALQMLSQEGLVTIKPRSGYFVTQITLKQLRDMLELREILEVAAIERAVDRVTEEELAQLEHVHSGYIDEGDDSYIRYMGENRRFHYLIARATGNLELAESLGRLHDRLLRFMILCRVGETLERRHAIVIEALRSRDIKAARQTILAEVNETSMTILNAVIEKEGAYWQLGNTSPVEEPSQ